MTDGTHKKIQPTVMYEKDHPVYPVLQTIGKEITHKVKPSAVVVFSAHWQATPDHVRVNNAVDTDLIYEYVFRWNQKYFSRSL